MKRFKPHASARQFWKPDAVECVRTQLELQYSVMLYDLTAVVVDETLSLAETVLGQDSVPNYDVKREDIDHASALIDNVGNMKEVLIDRAVDFVASGDIPTTSCNECTVFSALRLVACPLASAAMQAAFNEMGNPQLPS